MDKSFKLLPGPIILISRIFGILPIDLDTFEYSKFHLAITLAQSLIPLYQISGHIFVVPGTYQINSPYTFVIQMLFHYVISVANIGTKYLCTVAFKRYLKPIHREMRASHDFLRRAYNFDADREMTLLCSYFLLTCGVVMLPVYAARLVSLLIKRKARSGKKLIFFVLMYWQNLSVCCAELQFIFIACNLYYQFHEVTQLST